MAKSTMCTLHVPEKGQSLRPGPASPGPGRKEHWPERAQLWQGSVKPLGPSPNPTHSPYVGNCPHPQGHLLRLGLCPSGRWFQSCSPVGGGPWAQLVCPGPSWAWKAWQRGDSLLPGKGVSQRRLTHRFRSELSLGLLQEAERSEEGWTASGVKHCAPASAASAKVFGGPELLPKEK